MFGDALRVIEEAQRAYEEVRTRESSELSRVGVVGAALISEVLAKMRALISTLSVIEGSLESSRPPVVKLCEGLTYVNDNHVTSVIHRTPLTVISYDSGEGKVVVSNKRLSIGVGGRTLEIRFRNHVASMNMLSKEDLEKHANLIKVLASEKLELLNYAITITESCRRKLGLR